MFVAAMTVSTTGLTLSVIGTIRMDDMLNATNSNDPVQQLASDFLSGTWQTGSLPASPAAAAAAQKATPTQSDNAMAAAVNQTLRQFGVSLADYTVSTAADADQSTLNAQYQQRLDIVSFVGTLFQTLGLLDPNADTLSTSQSTSVYSQSIDSLISAVGAGSASGGTGGANSTGAGGGGDNGGGNTPDLLDALHSAYQAMPGNKGGQSLEDFLDALASNLDGGPTSAPVGVFVQTTA